MQDLPFTHKPGWRERHLKRKHRNPLFSWPAQPVAPERLLQAQKADHEEMLAFAESFRALVQRAVDLPPDAGSEEVIALKGELEQHYEQSYGLPEDHSQERQAIRKLVDLITKAIRLAAGEDPVAQQELADEEAARTIHRRLLEQPLVADLLRPDSAITPGELTATLLSALPSEVEAAIELFDSDQIAQIAEEGAKLADDRACKGVDMSQALERLAQILTRLKADYPQAH
ncbi:hypothetical protein [Thiorhodococcus minor]|uniref:Uncharacterized protein n=1 Tax=Thiorhodococcus minor TaxID=57489 RepID=A0A6M0JX99_9GAMM|nr:hypothetical protein [Thiorhodococcus minor]NEV61591.1 hypothetical protein [Thiorhodococcus minor]